MFEVNFVVSSISMYIAIYTSLMLALGGEGEGKGKKGLASGLPECCVFPKNEVFMAQRILEILHRQKKKACL
jgi:hypothetical protein